MILNSVYVDYLNVWWVPLPFNGTTTLSGQDSKHARRYQERDVTRAIKKVKNNEA